MAAQDRMTKRAMIQALAMIGTLLTGLANGDDLAASDSGVLLEVVEPYVDVHTGPGRGYPVFQVVEQGEQVRVLKRRTNWYKVVGKDFGEGWVRGDQIAHTIEPSGLPADLPSIGHGDYLKSRWRAGLGSRRASPGGSACAGRPGAGREGMRPAGRASPGREGSVSVRPSARSSPRG